jgi:hypothetical protein
MKGFVLVLFGKYYYGGDIKDEIDGTCSMGERNGYIVLVEKLEWDRHVGHE